MQELGIINNRTILYQKHDLSINWAKEFPDSNWLLLALVTNKQKTIVNEIACKALDHNVCYACCVGIQGELLHDFIDENIVAREVEIENNHLPDFDIMTTWHSSLKEGLWFSGFAARHESESIKTIFCLDGSENSHKEVLIELANKLPAMFQHRTPI